MNTLFPDALALRNELSRRGVSLEVRGDKLVCLPKGGAGELLPEVQRFKPQLIELLAPQPQPARRSWRDRGPDEWTAANRPVSPGAVLICRLLQDFTPLLAKARANRLALDALRVRVAGESIELQDVAPQVREMEAAWTARARECQSDRRELTVEEMRALESAREMLEWIEAARGEGVWLDVEARADEAHAQAKARAERRGAQLTAGDTL